MSVVLRGLYMILSYILLHCSLEYFILIGQSHHIKVCYSKCVSITLKIAQIAQIEIENALNGM